MLRKSQVAFTLAEVLIALALLGIIAAFTIPKVLQNSQNARERAAFKTTYASLQQILREGLLMREILPESPLYFSKRLNALQFCPTNYITEGCYTTSINPTNGSGFVLPSGEVILDIENSFTSDYCQQNACPDGIAIDINGNKAPNQVGIDLLHLILNYGTKTYTSPVGVPVFKTLTSGVGPGKTGPVCSDVNLALYNSIFDTNFSMADCVP